MRSQEGEAAFDTIERIRQTALRFHRDEDLRAIQLTINGIAAGLRNSG